jgi:hypothetical protein
MQDDFKVSPRLTLNLGLRYELEPAPTERFNRTVAAFDFQTTNPIEAQARANYAKSPIPEIAPEDFRARGGLTFAGVAGRPRTFWDADHNNFAPRIGMALRLPQSFLVRSGYGLYYITAGVDRIDAIQRGFSQATTLVPSDNNGQTFTATLSNPFPNGFERARGAAGGLSTDVGRSVTAFRSSRPHGYLQRWTLDLQKELPQRVLLDVSYVGSRGTKLDATRQYDAPPREYLSTKPTRDQPTIDLLTAQVTNPFYPMLAGTDLSGKTVQRLQLLRPFPEFSGIAVTEPMGYSWYHALQSRFERRFRSGFTGNASYTWSKFMEATSFLNPTDAMPEKVISDLDRQHRFTATAMQEMPFGPGKKWGSSWRGVPAHVAGGWQLSAIYQANSGPALGYGNILFYGDVHDIPLPAGERSVEMWFNRNAGFERDSTKQLAQNIRTFPSRLAGLRGKGINMWNMSALKNIRVHERVRIQFRCELLNATNHSHFSTPNMAPANLQFGNITATTGYPRQIYFALKLLY